MSKADLFLEACLKNLNKWTCSLHTSGSNQPAAIFREIKKRGYEFEETAPNRWATSRDCPVCKQKTTHYKLISATPVLPSQTRISMDKATRERILRLFDHRDAFTDGHITSVAEIDHKTHWTRLEQDIDASLLSDEELSLHFQLLTKEHNMLKNHACNSCKKGNIRPPFFGIPFWYDGDETYKGTCYGCGWFDGKQWRAEVSKRLLEKE